MALYRLEIKAISRAGSKSVAAAVAYEARTTVHDVRNNKTWRYPNRGKECVFSEIIAPPSPHNWLGDRTQLWAKVEEAEKRKDSTTARTLTIALPVELSINQMIELIRAFIFKELTPRGLIADFAIHVPARKFGPGTQPHVHLTITTREFDPETGTFAAKKHDWLNKKTTANEETVALRESWANLANDALERAGSDARVSHLRAARAEITRAAANDDTLLLHERATAAREAEIMSVEPESKIGYAAARIAREAQRDAAQWGEVVDFETALRERSRNAIQALDARAERELLAEAAPLWTTEDEKALAEAEADEAAWQAQAQKEADLIARIDAERNGWLGALDAVAARAADAGERYRVQQAEAATVRRRAEAEAVAREAERQLAVDRARLDAALGRLEAAMTARREAEAARQAAATAEAERRAAQDRARREAAQRARDVAALGAKLDREKGRDSGWRRINELGAGIEHGDGRTIVLAPSVASVAGYDATIKPGMRALIASDEARSKEPILLRALFSSELDAAKEAGRKVVALIDRGARAFAAWVREAAPHAEHLLPPGDALTWASLAPEPDLPDVDHDDDRHDDDFSPT